MTPPDSEPQFSEHLILPVSSLFTSDFYIYIRTFADAVVVVVAVEVVVIDHDRSTLNDLSNFKTQYCPSWCLLQKGIHRFLTRFSTATGFTSPGWILQEETLFSLESSEKTMDSCTHSVVRVVWVQVLPGTNEVRRSAPTYGWTMPGL